MNWTLNVFLSVLPMQRCYSSLGLLKGLSDLNQALAVHQVSFQKGFGWFVHWRSSYSALWRDLSPEPLPASFQQQTGRRVNTWALQCREGDSRTTSLAPAVDSQDGSPLPRGEPPPLPFLCWALQFVFLMIRLLTPINRPVTRTPCSALQCRELFFS
jgi:hypothetical protein